MRSVFGKVRCPEPRDLFLSNQELNLIDSGFPVNKDTGNENTGDLLSRVQELANWDWSSPGSEDTALFLLEKYLWSVPLQSKDDGSSSVISLYHHLKTTAAFASCIYSWQEETGKPLPEKEKDFAEQRPFLVVMGDLSGIQSFIYNIYNTKAKKALKGRSFYLQLLTETLIYEILKKTGFFRGNILFSAGGKFFLLLPNTTKVITRLQEFRKEILKWLWKEHKNTLYFALDWFEFGFYNDKNGKDNNKIHRIITLSEEDEKWVKDRKKSIGNEKKFVFPKGINKDDFWKEYKEVITLGDLWWLASEKLGEQKMQRWKLLLEEMKYKEEGEGFTFKNVFEQAEEGGAHSREAEGKEICAVTGVFAPRKEMQELKKGEGVYVLKSVYKQIELGEALAQAEYLIFGKSENEETIRIHNTSVSVVKEPGNIPEDAWVFKMNDLDFINNINEVSRTNKKIVCGFTFYGGNLHATVGKRPATFEELSQIDEKFALCLSMDKQDNSEDREIKELKENEGTDSHIAIFRSDVDSLGDLFIYGFLPNEQSFSLLSTMSFMLNWFFGGYLNTLQKQKEIYRKHLIIVYSGGDDVFVLGRWDVVLMFAKELREEFYRFVGEREDITLSAGIAVVKNKFPIRRAAEFAGEYEHKSKEFKFKDQKEKDAVTLFGVPVSWQLAKGEWDWVLKQVKKLYNALQKDIINTGFLHKLNSFYREAEKKGEIVKENNFFQRSGDFIMFLPRLSYDIARRRKDENKDILDTLSKIYWTGDNNYGISPQRAFVLISLAIQIALLGNRHFPVNEQKYKNQEQVTT